MENQNNLIIRFYCLHDGILFIQNTLNQEDWKVIIPRIMEKKLMLEYHIRYGHMGAVKVVKALEAVSYTHLDVYKRQVLGLTQPATAVIYPR